MPGTRPLVYPRKPPLKERIATADATGSAPDHVLRRRNRRGGPISAMGGSAFMLRSVLALTFASVLAACAPGPQPISVASIPPPTDAPYPVQTTPEPTASEATTSSPQPAATSASSALDSQPATEAKPKLTDEELVQRIIAESIASYPGNCPCPFNVDAAGRRCGKRSAYLRPGGASPLCFPNDVTPEIILSARTELEGT